MIKEYILAIESSCDDTAVALITKDGKLVDHKKTSSAAIHNKYGGVVPELAARYHAKNILPLIEELLSENKIIWTQIEKIAYTKKPGLSSCLFVGEIAAKTLANIYQKQIVPINHLDAHIYSIGLVEELSFPYLCFLASGKTTNLYAIYSPTKKKILNECLDIALGECFDKIARYLNLPYPGGPHIDAIALKSKATVIKLAQQPKNDTAWSFSGLQTACLNVIKTLQKQGYTIKQQQEIISHSFQEHIVTLIFNKLNYYSEITNINKWVFVGGVAANEYLRQKCKKLNKEISFVSKEFAVDNAAMIGYLAFLQEN